MQRLLSLKDFEREWRAALALTGSASNLQHPGPIPDSDGDAKCKGKTDLSSNDMFDCRSLKIPPTHTLINDVVNQFEEEWRELDERKIVSLNVESFALPAAAMEPSAVNHDQGTTGSDTLRPAKVARTQKRLPKWYTNRVRLPEQFDYASKRSHPPPDDGHDDRVISLLDPTQTLSYHVELWELFKNIPIAREIEATATRNVKLSHMRAISEHMAEQTSKPTPDSAYGLAPLRYKDRHDSISATLQKTIPAEASNLVPTIQFECWRRQLKRGISPE